MTDPHLLAAYQQTPSPELFSKLVTTYINLVFSVARRSTKNTHLAQDITQDVFLTLARKAPTLEPSTPLASWLFTTTRNISMQTLRAASRRSKHESEAAMSHQPPAQPDPLWPLIAEEIDSAVADLPPADSGIILLRYFANHSTAQVATALSISEDAAKKRLQRALESLEKLLTSRGFAACTAFTLATALTAHAVHAAPTTLAASISTKSAALLTAKGTLITAAKLKASLIAAATIALITIPTAIYFSNRTTTAATPTAESVPATAPAAPDDYRAAYALPSDQFLAIITDAEPAARAAIYKDAFPKGRGKIPSEIPGSIVVQWKTDQASAWGWSFSSTYPFPSLLAHLIDIYNPEIISSFALPNFHGDIVFRAGATSDQYLANLQTLLSQRYKRSVICSIQTIPMDIVVFSGQYRYTPYPDAPPTPQGKPTITFFVHTIDPNPLHNSGSASGSSLGNIRRFAGAIGEFIRQPVVIDSPNFPDSLNYRYYGETTLPLFFPADVPQFLQHISDQTGLKISHETRPVRCLVIKPQEARITANEWQGYPRLSPFEAIRWNADQPNVKLDGAWFQLLAINSVPIDRLITFAKQSDEKDWHRRFEEDFIALVSLMGLDTSMASPGYAEVRENTFVLTVKNLETGKVESPYANATKENRDAIHAALTPKK